MNHIVTGTSGDILALMGTCIAIGSLLTVIVFNLIHAWRNNL